MANTINATYPWCVMRGLDVIQSDIQQLSFILIVCISYGMVKTYMYGNNNKFTSLDFLCCTFSVLYLSFPLSLIINHDMPKPPRTRVAPCTLTDIHQSINLSCQLGSLPFFEDCAMEKKILLISFRDDSVVFFLVILNSPQTQPDKSFTRYNLHIRYWFLLLNRNYS